MLQKDQVAPLDIAIKDSEGKEVTLKDYLNQKYLLVYFYPEDDTPSCTTEACRFRDSNSEIEATGTKIIGISKDSAKSHTKFKDKYSLNFELLSDESKDLLNGFGVWGHKTMFGKDVIGTLRTTFLLDKTGKIVHVWENVQSQKHADEVLEFIENLTKNSK